MEAEGRQRQGLSGDVMFPWKTPGVPSLSRVETWTCLWVRREDELHTLHGALHTQVPQDLAGKLSSLRGAVLEFWELKRRTGWHGIPSQEAERDNSSYLALSFLIHLRYLPMEQCSHFQGGCSKPSETLLESPTQYT